MSIQSAFSLLMAFSPLMLRQLRDDRCNRCPSQFTHYRQASGTAIFWIAIIFVRDVILMITAAPRRTLLWMLVLEFLFLAGGIATIHFGFFADPDGWPLIFTRMLLVIAMAVQNAAYCIHLTSAPPSTLMTGTTTQIMIDVADLLHGTPRESKDSIGHFWSGF